MQLLRETQADLMAVLTGSPDADARLAASNWIAGTDGTIASPGAQRRGNRLPAERRLQVYRNNTRAALTGALLAVYPVLERLVGAECFAALAGAYVAATPSRSANLHDYGGTFAEFLARIVATEPALNGLPYLGDVARLEWALHRVFHAADAAPLTANTLASLPADEQLGITVARHPACRVLTSPWPVLRIWSANQVDIETNASDNQPVRLDEGADHLLVIRRSLDIDIDRLDPTACSLLATLNVPTPLDEACAVLLQAQPDADLGHALACLLAAGALVCVTELPA